MATVANLPTKSVFNKGDVKELCRPFKGQSQSNMSSRYLKVPKPKCISNGGSQNLPSSRWRYQEDTSQTVNFLFLHHF